MVAGGSNNTVSSSSSTTGTASDPVITKGPDSSSPSASSSTSESSSSSTSNSYDWVPTSSLVVNRPTSTSSATSSASGSSSTTSPDAASQGVSTSTVNGKPSVTITSQASFPTDLPSRIIPASDSFESGTALNAQAAQDKVPTTTISILLDDSMPWSWVVGNSDASGQIFYYVPQILSSALNISATQVETIALQAYQTTDSNDGSSKILTVFLGSIPANYVDALATMIKTPTSPIYSQEGLQGQMAEMFVSSFSVTSYASEDGSDSGEGSSNGGAKEIGKVQKKEKDDKSKKIIIAVVVTCGVVLLAIAGYFAFRATKRGAIALGGGSPKFDFRDRDMGYRNGAGGGGNDGGLRPFQLGGGYREGDRDSLSSTSTTSTTFSGSSPRGHGHGASTSVDLHGSDRRSSWWRFSDGSGSDGRGPIGLAIGGDGSGPMREGPRRTRVVSTAMIGR